MNFIDKKHWRWIPFLAIIIGLTAILLPIQVDARPPLVITLVRFEGFGMDNAVRLEWETATEFNTAGFTIHRANSENGTYVEHIGFIEAEGSGIEGAEYEAFDFEVVNGQTYWYKLIEIENSGTQNASDPISATAGEPTPTATATKTPTTQPTSQTNQPTATTTPTRTPTATTTSQPTSQSNSTAAPTNTAIPQQVTATSQTNTQPQATTSNGNTQTNNNNGGGNVVEASSPTDPYPVGTASPTFVPDPSQANEDEDATQTDAYPSEGDEAGGAAQEGYIAPTVENREAAETPAIQPQGDGDPRPLTTQPPLGQQTQDENETAEPGSSNTLFLWIGFAAAFLIFVGGVVGSIFLFTRRSNQK